MQANNIRIDPPYWFSGMKNGALQLLLSAPGIGRANVSVSHPGAALTGIARPYSPNYLFVCLDVSRAEPGLIPLHISLGGTGRTVMYELRRRAEGSAQRQGFTPADVLYLVMPDRFAQGRHGCAHASGLKPYKTDRSEPSLRHGGDLEGLRRHLDYIADLGVTAIWLTPIFENNNPDIGLTSSYHGYAVTDFYRVDPRLGSMDDYRRLVCSTTAVPATPGQPTRRSATGSTTPWQQPRRWPPPPAPPTCKPTTGSRPPLTPTPPM